MPQPTLKLELFEGPLDLLLSLINKNKMKISDIRISEICEQYLDYLSLAEQMDVELASEFIVMASELMLIKSRMLLPRQEAEEDPRAPLAEALLIYQQAKEAARLLLPRYAEYSGRMIKDEDEVLPLNELPTGLDPDRLTLVFLKLLSRMKAEENTGDRLIEPLVRKKPVPVRKMASSMLSFVRERKKASVVTLLAGASTRGELVASFIALLELIKQKVLLLCETEEQAERGDIDYSIALELNPDADPENLMTEYDGDEAESEGDNAPPTEKTAEETAHV